MRPLLRTAFALTAVSVALSACADQQTPAPTAPPRPSADVGVAVFTPVCDFNALKAFARDYAASNRDDLFTIIGDLQSLSKNGPNPNATSKAFDGLARLAAMRNTSAQKTTATGTAFNGLTTGFVGCMESYITNTVPSDFSVAAYLGTGYMYEVRGGLADVAGNANQKGASPYWSLQAPSGWGASIATSARAKRFLIYGEIDDFIPNDVTIGGAFDIKTIPAIAPTVLTFSSPLFVGLCDFNPGFTVRVQHVTTVLEKKTISCPDASTAQASSGFGPRELAHRIVDFFAPKPAYAAVFFGGLGGAVSELSPSVIIDMQKVVLTFVDPIADGQISERLDDVNGDAVQVLVTTQGGTPLSGVVVRLEISGNSSSIAYFKEGVNGTPTMFVERTTGSDGLATFGAPGGAPDVYLVKAGGYTLVATGSFDGVPGAPKLSNSFNYQNK